MLVTGSAGMTGFHVPEIFRDYELELTEKKTLDVRELLQIRKICQRFSPNIILHLAAETNIDLCEREPKTAFLTNAVGTQNIAVVSQEINALLVYFSTTSIFSGQANKIYSEFDTPNPVHTHGRSKWEGERLIHQFTDNFLIVRPGWMFGGFEKDKKFVGAVRRQIVSERKKIVRGIIDTKGSPTYALDCLQLTYHLIKAGLRGTYHVVNSGYSTRFEMAQVLAQHYDVIAEEFHSNEFEPHTKRPASEMAQNWMLEFYGLANYVRDWRIALKEYLEEWDKRELKKGLVSL